MEKKQSNEPKLLLYTGFMEISHHKGVLIDMNRLFINLYLKCKSNGLYMKIACIEGEEVFDIVE